jgi:hypothetical protein
MIGARVHDHRHGFAQAKTGVGEVQCDRTLSAPRATGEHMRATVSHTGEPIVEQRDPAAYDAANSRNSILLELTSTPAARWLRRMRTAALPRPSIHVPHDA